MRGALTSRSDAASRRIVRDWRALSGAKTVRDHDRRTLVACSGGADSSALALALPPDHIALAHIRHDLRSAQAAAHDRDAARRLADHLGVEFFESAVSIKTGNAEAEARRLRYGALEQLAADADCPYIATAHHADDQLETILMALLRGSGPAGVGAIAPTRPLGDRTLIRPMLDVERADTERICRRMGWTWVEDATNADATRFRAALRRDVLPTLRSLRPNVARRAASAAGLFRDAAGLIDDHVNALWPHVTAGADSIEIRRTLIADQRPIVIGALLRRAVEHLHHGRRLDRMTTAALDPVLDALKDDQQRAFNLSGVDVTIDAASIVLRSNA